MIDVFRYRSLQGDTLDLICYRHYGEVEGVVEQVMEANPSLADSGPVIAENTLVVLPKIAIAASNTKTSIQLWD